MQNQQLNHSNHETKGKKYSLCLLANDMDLTTNIGSFFRIADALGIEKLFLCGSSARPPHPKIKRTSRATEKYVDWSYEANAMDLLARLKSEGYKIISLEITENSIALDQVNINSEDKICLILGSEIEGVNPDLIAMSDICVHIPMQGHNSSMNVANACAIASYFLSQKLIK